MHANLLVIISIGLVSLILTVIIVVAKTFVKPIQPYYKNSVFISKAEQSFFKVLRRSYRREILYILSQVALNRLLRTEEKDWRYINKISQKSVDFVLVDKITFTPILIIELDDSTHNLPERVLRDSFLNSVLTAVELPFLRIPTKFSYNTNELKKMIADKVAVPERRGLVVK